VTLTQRNAIDRIRHPSTPASPQLSITLFQQPCCIRSGAFNAKRKLDLNDVTTTNTADGTPALLPAKKPKADQPEFAYARRACRTTTEREQLALILRARWTSAELQEYARLYYFKNGRDYPTPSSYRRAIADLARHYHLMTYTDAKPSQCPHEWLQQFRKDGSKLMPPRREGLLIRGRGLTHKIWCDEYSWPDYDEDFRSLIEQRCRDYFKIAPDQPVHVNAWAASWRAYQREYRAEAEAERIATEAVTLVLSPKVLKKSKAKTTRRKVVSSYDSGVMYDTLKPHFNFEFPGHSPAFLEEVSSMARKDRGLKPDAPISPHQWKITCNKRYCLIESPKV
jgi:hypothetical protein